MEHMRFGGHTGSNNNTKPKFVIKKPKNVDASSGIQARPNSNTIVHKHPTGYTLGWAGNKPSHEDLRRQVIRFLTGKQINDSLGYAPAGRIHIYSNACVYKGSLSSNDLAQGNIQFCTPEYYGDSH